MLLVTELECVPKPTMQSLNVREVSALGMSVAERVSVCGVCVCENRTEPEHAKTGSSETTDNSCMGNFGLSGLKSASTKNNNHNDLRFDDHFRVVLVLFQ